MAQHLPVGPASHEWPYCRESLTIWRTGSGDGESSWEQNYYRSAFLWACVFSSTAMILFKGSQACREAERATGSQSFEGRRS